MQNTEFSSYRWTTWHETSYFHGVKPIWWILNDHKVKLGHVLQIEVGRFPLTWFWIILLFAWNFTVIPEANTLSPSWWRLLNVLIVKQILLVSTIGNIGKTVMRICILIWGAGIRFNPFSPNIHIQILQTDLHTFPSRMCWENLFQDQSICFLVISLFSEYVFS